MRLRNIFLTAALMFVTGPVFAVDFTQSLKTFDGDSFKDSTGKEVPMVLGTIIENSLLAEQGTPDEKNKNFWLSLKIHNAKDYIPTPDEIVRMKKALAEQQPTVIMGLATQIIDPTYGK